MRMPNGNYSTDHDNYSTTRSVDPDGHAGRRLPNNNSATGHSFRGEGGERGKIGGRGKEEKEEKDEKKEKQEK